MLYTIRPLFRRPEPMHMEIVFNQLPATMWNWVLNVNGLVETG